MDAKRPNHEGRSLGHWICSTSCQADKLACAATTQIGAHFGVVQVNWAVLHRQVASAIDLDHNGCMSRLFADSVIANQKRQ